MRLAFLLYVLFAAAAMQELSTRLGTVVSSARLMAQRQLCCLEKAYKKAKRETQKAASRIISKWRGGEIREVHEEEDAADMDDIVARTEEFREKIRKLLAEIQARQMAEEGDQTKAEVEVKDAGEEAKEEEKKNEQVL